MALSESRFGPMGYQRLQFAATVPAGTAFGDILDPYFWANVAYKLNDRDPAKLARGSLIDVTEETFLWSATVRVLDYGKGWVKVAADRVTQYVEETPAAEGEIVAKYAGPSHRWRVTRGSEILEKGFTTEAEANEWIADHLKAVAA